MGQSRCLICNEPFIYWPNRQEVVETSAGFAHETCFATEAIPTVETEEGTDSVIKLGEDSE